MIYYIDKTRLPDLQKLMDQKNIYACKIACLFESYGLNYDFAEFWVQYDDENHPVSAISKFYGDMTVQTTDKTDFDELKEFLQITGFTSVLSEKELFSDSFSGMTMQTLSRKTGITAEVNPNLNEVYRLLQSCQSDSFEVPGYEDFILDMSHKIRHRTAVCVGVRSNGKLVSTAMTVAQSKNCAVIGAVATDKNCRHSGHGTKCVNTLCDLLYDRNIFIMRDENENERFYRSMGFENQGKFYIKRGKNL